VTPTFTPTPTATAPGNPVTPTFTPTPTATQTSGEVIDPVVGGTQSGQVGSLNAELSVPPGAVGEPIGVTLQAVTDIPSTGGFSLLGQGFSIEARTLGGAPVTQFAKLLTLVVRYTDADVAGLDENSLQIFYWDPAQSAWVPVPTTVDAATNTLTIQLDHLTLFAVLGPGAAPGVYLPLVVR
jgi:hypothetical protein